MSLFYPLTIQHMKDSNDPQNKSGHKKKYSNCTVIRNLLYLYEQWQ